MASSGFVLGPKIILLLECWSFWESDRWGYLDQWFQSAYSRKRKVCLSSVIFCMLKRRYTGFKSSVFCCTYVLKSGVFRLGLYIDLHKCADNQNDTSIQPFLSLIVIVIFTISRSSNICCSAGFEIRCKENLCNVDCCSVHSQVLVGL